MPQANIEYWMARSHQAEIRKMRERDRIEGRHKTEQHASSPLANRAMLFGAALVVVGLLLGVGAFSL